MGSIYSPRIDKSEAYSNPADLSSLGINDDVYVPLKTGEFVCFLVEGKRYLVEQKTDSAIEIDITGEPAKLLAVGDCLNVGEKNICSGSVVTTKREDATEASSGAPSLGSALSFVILTALVAIMLF